MDNLVKGHMEDHLEIIVELQTYSNSRITQTSGWNHGPIVC